MRAESPDRLGRLQARFLTDLSGPDERSRPARSLFFEAPPRGSIADRWAIYRDGYVARIVEALENDFRGLRRVLGRGAFCAMTGRYLRSYPPFSFDIGQAGARLPEFLRDDHVSRALPFLADLARLERTQLESFVARDATALAWSDLARLGPDAAADLPLRLCPGTALLRSAWPVLDIWSCRDLPDEEVSLQVEGRPTTVMVYRRGLEVRTRAVAVDEARIVEAASNGSSLAALAAAGVCGNGATGMQKLLELLHRLVDEGLFLKPGAPDSPAPQNRKESPCKD